MLNNAIYKGLKDFLGKSDIADVYFDYFKIIPFVISEKFHLLLSSILNNTLKN